MKDNTSENYYKKEIELGRWRIIQVKIINKKEIELGRWRIIKVKIINKKEIELGRWRIIWDENY